MLLKIKKILNNEKGGPNIENIYVIGLSLLCSFGLLKIWNALQTWIPSILVFISDC